MSIVCVIALSGCATRGSAIPQADGIYSATSMDWDANGAREASLKTAEETCTKRGMRYVVTDQKARYKGGPIWLGHPLFPDNSDYESTITFKCEST